MEIAIGLLVPLKKKKKKKKLCSQRTLLKLGEFEALTLNYVGYGCILWVIQPFFFLFFMML
jgi:hypothetical protein